MMKHMTVIPENYDDYRLTLALDMDSTLADSLSFVYDLLDTDYTLADQETWEWPREQFGTDKFLGTFAAAWADHWYCIDPTEDADHLRWAVKALRQWFEVDIVTTQPDDPAVIAGKKAWLEYYDIPYDNFVTVDPDDTKAHLRYSIYVDDKPTLPSQVNGTGGQVYLIDRRYNQDAEGEYDRVRTVSDVARAEKRPPNDVMGPAS